MILLILQNNEITLERKTEVYYTKHVLDLSMEEVTQLKHVKTLNIKLIALCF